VFSKCRRVGEGCRVTTVARPKWHRRVVGWGNAGVRPNRPQGVRRVRCGSVSRGTGNNEVCVVQVAVYAVRRCAGGAKCPADNVPTGRRRRSVPQAGEPT